jgi:hypothetical protein
MSRQCMFPGQLRDVVIGPPQSLDCVYTQADRGYAYSSFNKLSAWRGRTTNAQTVFSCLVIRGVGANHKTDAPLPSLPGLS